MKATLIVQPEGMSVYRVPCVSLTSARIQARSRHCGGKGRAVIETPTLVELYERGVLVSREEIEPFDVQADWEERA